MTNGYDENEQCRMAAQAQKNGDARSMLAASLQPLTDHVVNIYLSQIANDGRSRSDLAKELENVAESALDRALTGYNDDPSYKIGTYYSWWLREYAARWFKNHTSGD